MFLVNCMKILSKVRDILSLTFLLIGSYNLNGQNTCWSYEYRYEKMDTFKLRVADSTFYCSEFKIRSQFKYIYDEPYIIILPGKLDNGKFFDISLPVKINTPSMDTIIYNLNNNIFYNKKDYNFYQVCYNNKVQGKELIKKKKDGLVELINQVEIQHKSNIPSGCILPELAIYRVKGMGQIYASSSFKNAKLMKYNNCNCLPSTMKQRLNKIYELLESGMDNKINCLPNSFLQFQSLFDNFKSN